MSEEKKMMLEEREITKVRGFSMLFLVLLGFVLCVLGIIAGCVFCEMDIMAAGVSLIIVSILGIIFFSVLCSGFKVLNPKEALVLTLFGTYYGTIKAPGFYFVNPFCSAVTPQKTDILAMTNALFSDKGNSNNETATANLKKKISLKTQTLNNAIQKVNDALGNPIIIGTVVIWKVTDPTKAVFNVDDYATFLSTQCDSTVRKITRLYPYDLLEEEENEESNEKTLRGSSQEIAESMKLELQQKVMVAGIEVEDVRITHLSYAEEIAAAMLQKQQAAAVISARKKIVEGAVGMVQQAIDKLSEDEIVVLDEERKAAMVSNLLVVLCGDKGAQPVVNSGTIY
ncbi:MAG: SPFH domain-containing protein [Lachnospira sp.]|nr:SPFH domain-containing protein [Lachnospira sp.]